MDFKVLGAAEETAVSVAVGEGLVFCKGVDDAFVDVLFGKFRMRMISFSSRERDIADSTYVSSPDYNDDGIQLRVSCDKKLWLEELQLKVPDQHVTLLQSQMLPSSLGVHLWSEEVTDVTLSVAKVIEDEGSVCCHGIVEEVGGNAQLTLFGDDVVCAGAGKVGKSVKVVPPTTQYRIMRLTWDGISRNTFARTSSPARIPAC